MSKGEDIFTCFKNVQNIYDEVSEMIQYLEEKFKNTKSPKIIPSKGTGCTWNSSNSYLNSDHWMNKFFTRYYFSDSKNYKGKAIGFCIWLFDYKEKMMFLEKPYISCFYVEYNYKNTEINREWFQYAEGYSYHLFDKEKPVYLAEPQVAEVGQFNKMIFYILDLTYMSDDEKLDNYVIDPLKKMFKGNMNNFLNNLDKTPFESIPQDMLHEV